jgi:hypothetical protein
MFDTEAVMAASIPRRCRTQQKDYVSKQSRSNETLANSQNMQQNVTSYVFGMGPATWTQPNQREGTMEHKGDQTRVQARTNNSTPTHNTTNILATASQPNIRNHEATRAAQHKTAQQYEVSSTAQHRTALPSQKY